MTEKLRLEPSPDHPITIEPNPKRVIVRVGDLTLADTRGAVTLTEAKYAPVLYIPLADVTADQLSRTDHHSYCPYKGEASYYSIPASGEAGENAVWEYRDPYPLMSELKGRVAFYADRVAISEES